VCVGGDVQLLVVAAQDSQITSVAVSQHPTSTLARCVSRWLCTQRIRLRLRVLLLF
jgi:hypothetical protein